MTGLEGLTIEECAVREPELNSFKTGILEGFHSGKKEEWQCQVERSRDGANQVLLLRGTCLPHVSGGGGVVVFDDITSLLQAQRTAAWGEVARRLAHEIKIRLPRYNSPPSGCNTSFREKLRRTRCTDPEAFHGDYRQSGGSA